MNPRTYMFGAATLALAGALGCSDGDASPDTGADAGGSGDTTAWRLVWSDEFEGSAQTPPDARWWGYDIGGDGWGNEQLEFDTDRLENAALDGNGNLVITARRELMGGRSYTSARITTKGRVQVYQGRIEARMRMPLGSGLWPAFWMLGGNIDEVSWPACGEIDIVEYRGQEPGIANAALHGPGYSGGQAIHDSAAIAGGGLHRDFHLYAVEWGADEIRWFVDDVPVFQVTRSDLPPLTRWAYDQPFFLILNLAVGGTYVGPVGPDTQFPQSLTVDYVRIYVPEP